MREAMNMVLQSFRPLVIAVVRLQPENFKVPVRGIATPGYVHAGNEEAAEAGGRAT